MTWDPKAAYKPEVQKCRTRLVNYCQGSGLDIGCGIEKITPSAIGVDLQGGDINCDISAGLKLFSEGTFDYVFSSHALEDLKCTESILMDWWSKIKVNGLLILYLPHRDYYPNVGQTLANPSHQHDFVPEDILAIMRRIACFETIVNEVHSENDEYSFELVLKKLANKVLPLSAKKEFKDNRPRALIIRYGAFGDHIIASTLPKALSEDGYHVTYNCTNRALPVIANNPYIDELLIQGDGLVPNRDLDQYWQGLAKGYDKVVNLSESVEVKFLAGPDRPEYKLTQEERRDRFGVGNYYDYPLELAGYVPDHPRPYLYPSPIEDALGAFFRRKYQDNFLVLWSLQGSAMHKAYPFAEEVAMRFLAKHKDAMTITVGDNICRLLEWDHPRALKKADDWPIRASLLMTKWVDLVIAPETGLLNAAGCYPTPKIGMLTHSNKNNLTKYFSNDYSMQAEIACSPCHRMIYYHNAETDCPHMDLGDGLWFCACGPAFPPDKMLARMELVYEKWKREKEGRGTFEGKGGFGINAIGSKAIIRPEQALRDFRKLRRG